MSFPEIKLSQVDYELTPGGYEIIGGEPVSLHGLQRPDIVYEDLAARFEEGNETYQVATSPEGRSIEIVVFNAGKLSVARIVKPSTSFSSAYKNPANMLQTALEATANPDAAYIYVGSFGNHPTGHMKLGDLAYVASHGRYTRGSGTVDDPYRALGSVVDMAETLDNNNLSPTHFSTDGEAGRLALGLMVASGADSVRQAYLNGIDGISPSAKYVPARLSEDMISRIHRRGVADSQPGELTPVNIKDLKQKMPKVYHGLGHIAHIAPLPVFLYPRDVFDKLLVTSGFMRHNNLQNPSGHAVFQDARAALLRQEATVTMQFNSASAIHNLTECIRFGKMVMDSVPEEMRSDTRRLRLLIGEGGLDQYVDQPHDRTRIERHALDDILHRMSMIGGQVLDRDTLHLAFLRQSA